MLVFSCKENSKYSLSYEKKQTERDTLSISEINFYLESSLSMKGYVNSGVEGSYPLKEIIPFLISDINNENSLNVNIFLITDKEEKYSRSQKAFFEELRSGNLLNGKSSNLQNVFKNMIATSITGKVNILVSDCIVDLGENNNLTEKSLVTNEIYEELNKREDLGVAVFKYISDFNGDFYFDRNNTKPMPYKGTILHNRPFYVWVFGNNELVTDILSQNIFKDFKDFYTYNIAYKLEGKLLNHPKSGKIAVNSSDNSIRIREITKKQPAKFTIGLKAEKESELTNKLINNSNNYKISPDFLKDDVKFEVKDLSILKENIPNKSLITNEKYTHFLQPTLYGFDFSVEEITLEIMNRKPLWIDESNLKDDFDQPITVLENKTFGFSCITDAFDKVFGSEESIYQIKLNKVNN